MPGNDSRDHRPVDPDVDLRDPGQRRELVQGEGVVLAAIAVGGVVGAEARYGLGLALPHPAAGFAWSTVLINIVGSFLIGVLMTILGRRRDPPRLVRPFLGVGVLGGFTTFSTFAVDATHLLAAERPGIALTYVAGTLAGCLAAVAAGVFVVDTIMGRAGP